MRSVTQQDVQDVEKRIFSILVATIGGNKKNAKITPDQHLRKDLGIDSMALLSLALGFEEEFGIKLPQTELSKALTKTVGELVAFGASVVVGAQQSGTDARGVANG